MPKPPSRLSRYPRPVTGDARKSRATDRPIGPWITDALLSAAVADAAALVFEYVATTQVEAGRPPVERVEDLPAVLRRDCERPAESFVALLVSYLGDTATGCVGVRATADPGTVEITRLYVRPAHRGAGIARALMLAAHGWAAAHGAVSVILSVMPSRTRVVEFYRGLGYVDAAPYEDYPLVYLRLALTDLSS